MNQRFKEGDRVYIAHPHSSITPQIELLGTLHEDKNDTFYIETDIYFNGHSAGERGKKGHCWYILKEDILRSAGPPLTKQERINLKCKELWNKSKYVQKNPGKEMI